MRMAATRITREIRDWIREELDRVGLLYRVFFRVKSDSSYREKLLIKEEKYRDENRGVRDFMGVRINLYFIDDIEVVESILMNRYELVEREIDRPNHAEFGPTRFNLVFKLLEEHRQQLLPRVKDEYIEPTFEVQIRTVLSEGWHEVEHDLRYKCKEEWENRQDLSRSLNGIVATLETCDWTMIKVFEELSWRQYKDHELLPMIRNKYRLRLQPQDIADDIRALLLADNELVKKIFRADRIALLVSLQKSKIAVPMTPSNLVFLINRFLLKDDRISELEPEIIREKIDRGMQ